MTVLLEQVPVIVRTRLRPPDPHPGELLRPHLLSRLNQFDEPVILLAAARGSGKSVLLSQWVRGCRTRYAWVDLGPRKASVSHVWSAILQALEPLCDDECHTMFGDLTEPHMLLDRVIPRLLNALATTEPLVLVLDGVDNVVDPTAKESLTHFVLQLPGHVRTVLATSRPAGGPVALLRANGRLAELSCDDLRFSVAEARQLLERVAGRTVSEDEARRIHQEVAGWAVGLRLAGLALRRGHDRRFPPEVVEYVRAEVLDKAEPEERAAIVQTSILTELRSDVVAAVAGSWATHALASFAATSLFLKPSAEGWVRHPALTAAATEYLAQSEPVRRGALHARAARTLAQQQDFLGATAHAIEAGRFAEACELLGAAWPAAGPTKLLEQVNRLGAELAGPATLAGAAAALAQGDAELAQRLLSSHDCGACPVQGLAFLQRGELAEARACVDSVPGTGGQDSWHAVLSELVGGYIELWEGHISAAVIALEAAASAAAKIGYCDALIRALDGMVACAATSEDHHRADAAARRAVTAHQRDPRRTTVPIIAMAYLETSDPDWSGERSPAELPTSGMAGGPHQIAFAEFLRASAARAAGQHVDYRLAQSRGRSVLTLERAGSLLTRLLAEPAESSTSDVDGRVTMRELAVLKALSGPLTLREIAREFHVSHNTIKTQVSSLFRKLGAHDRASAVRAARERALIARSCPVAPAAVADLPGGNEPTVNRGETSGKAPPTAVYPEQCDVPHTM